MGTPAKKPQLFCQPDLSEGILLQAHLVGNSLIGASSWIDQQGVRDGLMIGDRNEIQPAGLEPLLVHHHTSLPCHRIVEGRLEMIGLDRLWSILHFNKNGLFVFRGYSDE